MAALDASVASGLLALAAMRGAVVLGGTLGALRLLRKSSAATRRAVLVLGLGGAAALPALSAVTPTWRVPAPAPVVSLAVRGVVVAEPLADTTAHRERGEAPVIARATAPRSLSERALPLVGALWALGALVVLGRLGVGLRQTRALRRRARATSAFDRAIGLVGARTGHRLTVRVSDEVFGPAVSGIVSPVVLVPEAAEGWPLDRQVSVLLHESSHVSRHDCLAHVVAEIACAVHWFDPLVWVAARRLRLERELAADDAALLAGATPSSYAEGLLEIAGALSADEVLPSPSGTLAMAEPPQLATRVVGILSKGNSRMSLSRPKLALLTASFSGGVLALACTTPKPAASAASPATPAALPIATSAASTGAASDGASTIDPRVQAIAEDELDRMMGEWRGAAGVVLVLDPATGEIVANAGRDHGKRADVATGHAYVTGSTFKAMTLAAALEDKVLDPAQQLDCEKGKRAYGDKVLEDYKPFGVLSVPEALAVSSNIAFSKIFDKLGGKRLDHFIHAFRFGEATDLGGATGVVPGPFADGSFDGAVAAVGEAVTASPLQMAAAYAVLANDGAYVAPTRSHRSAPPARTPVVRPETARAVVTMLEGAVNSERATGAEARIADGPRVAGKTGTAAWERPASEGGGKGTYASFVGLVPAQKPRWVIVVGVEQPRDGASGGKVAAPVFARIVKRAFDRP